MHEPHDIVLLYVPCGSEEEAVNISTQLLERGLIACANIYESRSLYQWEGKIADEREKVLICKTVQARSRAARTAILELHSYSVPCVITIEPEEVNSAYAGWIRGEVFGTG
jgi:periplasmic divalent cation tolerance protein